ncbi:myo-inositol transporter [Fusarium agapanthi]|uniref:Myo-inositol transporter n=1 Tax=Fusarium agapanthi TaxID=1803897 RepID=A0A9P5AY68_9HYPO|nr:myo-inositol transporter [Fusarium agapanthi]
MSKADTKQHLEHLEDTGSPNSIHEIIINIDDLDSIAAPDTDEKELITSSTSGGAFLGAIFAGCSADRCGRKVAIYVGCVLSTVGAIIQAASFSVAQMTVGRLIVGFGVGSAAMIIPLCIAECAPSKYRGRMIGLDNISVSTKCLQISHFHKLASKRSIL